VGKSDRPDRTDGERLDRREQIVQILAEDQVSLQNLIGELATETRRGFDRVQTQFEEVAKHMRETDERMRETDERMRQTDERMRQTDARIDKRDLEDSDRRRYFDQRVDNLVIAIRESIRRQNGPAA